MMLKCIGLWILGTTGARATRRRLPALPHQSHLGVDGRLGYADGTGHGLNRGDQYADPVYDQASKKAAASNRYSYEQSDGSRRHDRGDHRRSRDRRRSRYHDYSDDDYYSERTQRSRRRKPKKKRSGKKKSVEDMGPQELKQELEKLDKRWKRWEKRQKATSENHDCCKIPNWKLLIQKKLLQNGKVVLHCTSNNHKYCFEDDEKLGKKVGERNGRCDAKSRVTVIKKAKSSDGGDKLQIKIRSKRDLLVISKLLGRDSSKYNIGGLVQSHEDADNIYLLVPETSKSQTLEDMDKTVTPNHQKWDFVRQILRALVHAHKSNVYHVGLTTETVRVLNDVVSESSQRKASWESSSSDSAVANHFRKFRSVRVMDWGEAVRVSEKSKFSDPALSESKYGELNAKERTEAEEKYKLAKIIESLAFTDVGKKPVNNKKDKRIQNKLFAECLIASLKHGASAADVRKRPSLETLLKLLESGADRESQITSLWGFKHKGWLGNDSTPSKDEMALMKQVLKSFKLARTVHNKAAEKAKGKIKKARAKYLEERIRRGRDDYNE